MTETVKEKLFAVIRCGMDVGDPAVSLPEEECALLLKFGARQSILPVVCRGMEKMGIPKESLGEYRDTLMEGIFHHLQRLNALEEISSALDDAKIPYVPLKGAVLQNLYPEPYMRTSSDLDVLVPEDQLDAAVKAIERQTDFNMRLRNYHDISMVNSCVHLELHFSIKENMENIDRLLGSVWDYAEPTGEGTRYAFTPEFQVFHVIAHMSYHMVHGGLGIRPFFFFCLLRRKTQFDETAVHGMCADCGILTFYNACCELADAWMNGKSIPATLKLLEEYSLNGGVFGSSKNAVASRMREKTGVQYVLKRLFEDRSVLEAEYPKLKNSPWLLPVCQVKRWAKLLDREKRKNARLELKNLSRTGREAVDSYDQLLKNLGL